MNFSLKDIPNSSEDTYIMKLINATETFTRNMRWKAFFFLNPGLKTNNIETYGFKSPRTPPIINEMKTFERRMDTLIKKYRIPRKTQ